MSDNFISSAFAPASIGNFIVGFDVLGLAVKPVDDYVLGDQVTVELADTTTLAVTGSYQDWVPQGEDNLVFKAAKNIQAWLASNHHQSLEFSLELKKQLPVGSGTGSSAASVVAAVQALAGLLAKHDIEIPMSDRWKMMGELEGSVSGGEHLDNIAPAVLGGLVLCPENGSPRQLPFFDDWYLVLAYNGQKLLTSDARACLPDKYSRQNTIIQMQRMAAVMDGLYRKDQQSVLAHLKDTLAEPYRADLIEDYAECKAALLRLGASAVGISGAGPSFFAISNTLEQANALSCWLHSNMNMHEGGFVHVCKPWYP